MLKICLKRITVRIFSQRYLTLRNNSSNTNTSESIINSVIGRLSVNYKNELDQLQKMENENVFERIQYLTSILQTIQKREQILSDINETKKLSIESNDDDDISKLAIDEINRLQTNLNSIDNEIIDHILPKQTADNDDAEIEVTAGVGGQEAMLFAKELFQMYNNYANFRKWSFKIVEYDKTDIGGLRQGKAFIDGLDVFKSLKYECGVHRVQRVPQTEKGGRIHTSTVTVAVLPQPKEIKIELPPKDVIAEPIRARGPGGQHVNKSESGCRLTHIPTGTIIERQDERFFNLNKNLAIKAMKNKLYQMQYDEQQALLFRTRKQQIGSGNRNEKIRTYNVPQNRITDERLDENAHNISDFLDGSHELHSMIEKLKKQDKLQRLVEMNRNLYYFADKVIQQSISDAFECIKLKTSMLHQSVSQRQHDQRNSSSMKTVDYAHHQNGLNRSIGIQYSYSLNQPLSTKINRNTYSLTNLQNYFNEFIENIIHRTLTQISIGNLVNDNTTEPYLSCVSIENLEIVNIFINRFIRSIIDQAIEECKLFHIRIYSNHLANAIITDILSTITTELNNNDRNIDLNHCLSTNHQMITSNLNEHIVSIDCLVNNIAQKIYIQSFSHLKELFTNAT